MSMMLYKIQSNYFIGKKIGHKNIKSACNLENILVTYAKFIHFLLNKP